MRYRDDETMPRRMPDTPKCPVLLQAGHGIRYLSPASTPVREAVETSAAVLRSWRFQVDFGQHMFRRLNCLAGADDERLADLNEAFRDPAGTDVF
jgi:muramoyltetrapeptide carboxypeptidase